MRKPLYLRTLLALVVVAGALPVFARATDTPSAVSAHAKLSELSQAFREVAKTVKPSVVHIAIKVKPSQASGPMMMDPGFDIEEWLEEFRREGRPPQMPRPQPQPQPEGDDLRRYDVPRVIGSGSGWVYSEQGYIVTNNHVIESASEVEVRFHDETSAKAEVVGTDPRTDIAVLRVKKKGLVAAKLSNEPTEQGDIVFAFGSPFHYAFSMSQGIISGKGRQVGLLGPDGYEDFIQTDAAINPGNSGGPLTDIHGRVIGMNTAIATRTGAYNGIGFAIPAPMLERVVQELIAHGQVRRGYLGAYIGDDPKMLKSFGVEKGVYIDDLIDGSPAADSGLKRGDVLLAIDGNKMEDANRLRSYIASKKPGHQAKLVVWRDGKRESLTLTLGELPTREAMAGRDDRDRPDKPDAEEKMQPLRKLGLEALKTLTDADVQRYQLPMKQGVLVTGVRPNSVADASGLTRGNIITHVGGKATPNVERLAELVNSADLEAGVRMTVYLGNGRTTYVFLSLEED